MNEKLGNIWKKTLRMPGHHRQRPARREARERPKARELTRRKNALEGNACRANCRIAVVNRTSTPKSFLVEVTVPVVGKQGRDSELQAILALRGKR